jgi:hypothetical protein
MRCTAAPSPYAIAIALSSAAAFAQEPPARVLQALRLEAGDMLRLDGTLDEPFWTRAAPATDFVQRDPQNGAPATERTEVRLVYDEHRIVLGVICYDREPQRVLGNQMQRDQSFEADDRFVWTIDSFLDGRSGYFFEINPSGAMGDGLIDPSGGERDDELGAGVNKSWDGIWLARVRRTPRGWTAEIELPLRTLNFDHTSATWGINFQRTIRRKNEESLWAGHARNQGVARMSNAGRLTGLTRLSQGLGLDLKPYVVATAFAAPGRGRDDAVAKGDAGLDIFYNLTPALRANLSINTDFAETEVDERRVNLTRFPLFFEEKRDFFLEGSSFFDFGREPEQAVVPFFSRRIGLDAEGNPQRIDVGAKLTGQAGAFDIGMLQVRTAEEGLTPGEDFSVMRIRSRLFAQSYLGALYTRRSARSTLPAGPLAGGRHTAGIDLALRTSSFRGNQNLELSALYLWTTPAREGGGESPQSHGSGAWAVRLEYPNDPVSASLSVRELQEAYDPAVGFVERRGYRRVNPRIEWAPRPRDHRWIRNFEFGADVDVQNDTRNRPLTRQYRLTLFDVNLHSGDSIRIEATPTYERLDEDFEISEGIVLPMESTHRFTRYELGLFSADHRVITLEPQVEFGGFFSGSRQEYSLELGIRPRRGVRLDVEAEHNIVDLDEGRFEADVYRASASTQFSPWMSLSNTLQYDTESRLLGWQLRYRWIRRPGNDIYFVYTHNWREGDPFDPFDRRFLTVDNRAAMKGVYTLRF